MGNMSPEQKWHRRSLAFKQQVVARMKACDNIRELADELQIQRYQLYRWKYQLEGRPPVGSRSLAAVPEDRREQHLREENRRLKELLGQKALENDFFKHALLRIKARRASSTGSGA